MFWLPSYHAAVGSDDRLVTLCHQRTMIAAVAGTSGMTVSDNTVSGMKMKEQEKGGQCI